MSQIKELDQKTIQLIAAGEVIDRPCSIVKELIENSLDANATHIRIEEEEGGKELIRIADDGCGMNEEDISLAFLPHHTSKLQQIEDLDNLLSYGFRGEALASVSAVSKINVISKKEGESVGINADISEHKIIKKKPIATNQGTIITVSDLFYNAPVRKKFLKSNRAESMAISDVVMRGMLSKKEVGFEYYRDGKNIYHIQGSSSLKEKIYLIHGRDIESHMRYFEVGEGDICIEGAVSDNSLYRGNRSNQYLFINERAVFVPNLSKVIENQYRSLIPHNKFPIYFIYLNIPYSMVDVNVHPNKKEVRLIGEDRVIELLIKALRDTLFEVNHFRGTDFSVGIFNKEVLKNSEGDEEEKIEDRKNLRIEPEDFFTQVVGIREELEGSNLEDSGDMEYMPQSTPILIANEAQLETFISSNSESITEEEISDPFENLRFIGTLFNSYILFEDIDSSLVIIDQHAAHERILYERFREKYKMRDIATQMLIKSESLTLSDTDKTNIFSNIEVINRFGFIIEDFGDRDILIRGVPNLFDFPTAHKLLLNIIGSLNECTHLSEFQIEKIMKEACVNAIKFGDRVYEEDVSSLISQLRDCDFFETCPHGRPTVVKIKKNDFAKIFLRV